MAAWGFDTMCYSVDRRVPAAARLGHEAARSFLLGLLDGDGTQGTAKSREWRRSVYSAHMANRLFLEDALLLCQYVGIEARLHGPYHPGPKPEYVSWRLDMHAFDVENVLFPGRLYGRRRSRITRNALAPRSVCDDLLAALRRADLQTESHKTLYARLLNGGSTHAWTLREMYLAAGAPVPALYDTVPVRSVSELRRKAPVYTLRMAHPLHQYVSHGLVAKNSGSDYVTMEMVLIQDELDRHYPDAHIILHGHDAVYVECYERQAEDICKLVDKIFGYTVVEGPMGSVALTAEAKIGKDLIEAK